MCKASVLSVGLIVEEDDSPLLSDGLAVVLESEDVESLPLLVGLIVVLEMEDGDSLSLSDGLAVELDVGDVESLPLLVGLIVVLEVEDDDSLSLSDGLAVVVDDFVSLLALGLVVASAELLAVVLEVPFDFPLAEPANGGRTPGLLAPLPAAGQRVITARSLEPAEI
jgi:hypothetical protein